MKVIYEWKCGLFRAKSKVGEVSERPICMCEGPEEGSEGKMVGLVKLSKLNEEIE